MMAQLLKGSERKGQLQSIKFKHHVRLSSKHHLAVFECVQTANRLRLSTGKLGVFRNQRSILNRHQ